MCHKHSIFHRVMLGMSINFYDMQTCVALVHFIFSFLLLIRALIINKIAVE